MMMRRRRLTAVLAGLTLTVLLIGAALLVPRYVYGRNAFVKPRGVSGVSYRRPAPQTMTMAVDLVSQSGSTLRLEPVTMPHGLPRGVRLVGQAIYTGGADFAAPGWPPRDPQTGDHFPIAPIHNYRIPPHGHASMAVGFHADRPGIYVIGPVSVHADVLGVPIVGTVPTELLDTQYMVMCLAVSEAKCHHALMETVH